MSTVYSSANYVVYFKQKANKKQYVSYSLALIYYKHNLLPPSIVIEDNQCTLNVEYLRPLPLVYE